MENDKEVKVTPALETMVGAIIPPNEIHLTFKFMSTVQALQDVANSKWICMIPYCAHCKEPLNLIHNTNRLFECPKCHTTWLKSESWGRDSENGATKLKGIRSRLSEE